SHLLCRVSISRRILCLFVSTATPPTKIYTLSLHDALPIYLLPQRSAGMGAELQCAHQQILCELRKIAWCKCHTRHGRHSAGECRSEEHTSELQSHLNLVCRLLLEKKKKKRKTKPTQQHKTT